MSTGTATRPGLTAFAATPGDLECRPEEIEGFAELWQQVQPDTAFSAMGSGTYRKLTGPPLGYLVDCVQKILGEAGVLPEDVDRLVLATSDGVLGLLGRDLAAQLLQATGMTRCVPAMLSYQQCCSSLEALRHADGLFADDDVRHVVLLALDFTPVDADRLRSFAVFGDAVAGCLLSRDAGPGSPELSGTGLAVDHLGLDGRDTFRSRQEAAATALRKAFAGSGRQPAELSKVFCCNLFVPIASFNAMSAGLPRDRLHFLGPMRRYGHCGNADWMINLLDHAGREGLRPGELYLAQSSAPGFNACALLTVR